MLISLSHPRRIDGYEATIRLSLLFWNRFSYPMGRSVVSAWCLSVYRRKTRLSQDSDSPQWNWGLAFLALSALQTLMKGHSVWSGFLLLLPSFKEFKMMAQKSREFWKERLIHWPWINEINVFYCIWLKILSIALFLFGSPLLVRRLPFLINTPFLE